MPKPLGESYIRDKKGRKLLTRLGVPRRKKSDEYYGGVSGAIARFVCACIFSLFFVDGLILLIGFSASDNDFSLLVYPAFWYVLAAIPVASGVVSIFWYESFLRTVGGFFQPGWDGRSSVGKLLHGLFPFNRK